MSMENPWGRTLFLRSGAGRSRPAHGVLPALRRAHVGVAEPQAAVEGAGAVRVGSLQPQASGDHGGVAEDAHRLRSGVLVLLGVDDGLVAGALEQFLSRNDPPGAKDQHEIRMQDAVHAAGVIHFDRRLVGGVERGHGMRVVSGGVGCAGHGQGAGKGGDQGVHGLALKSRFEERR